MRSQVQVLSPRPLIYTDYYCIIGILSEYHDPGESHRSFRLRRRLTIKNKNAFAFAATIGDAFPGKTIEPKLFGSLCLTLIEKGEVNRAREANSRLKLMPFGKLATNLLASGPPSAKSRLFLPVTGVEVYGTDPFVKSLAITLGDPDKTFQNERQTYANHLEKLSGQHYRWKEPNPHLTIATIDITQATSDVFDWVLEQAPNHVAVSPVTPDPRLPKEYRQKT